jgi:hypothetical protein
VRSLTVPTFTVEIYMAGNVQDIERTCALFCMTGFCVSIEPTKFIYTGGREDGAVVRVVNYPRFPAEPAALREKARALAVQLMADCCQWSALLVDPQTTEWLTKRPEDQRDDIQESRK